MREYGIAGMVRLASTTAAATIPGMRRSSEDWAAIKVEAEKAGWSHADVARRLGVGRGSVSRAFARVTHAADDGAEKVSNRKKMPEKPAQPNAVQRLLADLSADQERALWLLVEGRTNTEIGQIIGRDRGTIATWRRDVIFAAALSSVLAERHVATLAALTSLAQDMVGHQGAAARLARKLIDEAAARVDAGPPVLATQREADAWQKTTDSMMARALEASRVLNSSPILATGGYPKTERVEVEDGRESAVIRDADEIMGRLQLLEGGVE